ncbi:MAG: sigma factor [Thermomicrobiales bacterium]
MIRSVADAAAATSGEATADRFAQIYHKLFPPLYGYVHFRVGDRHVAEDITAQVFERALSHVATVRQPDRLRPWLFAIARNAVAEYCGNGSPSRRDKEMRPEYDTHDHTAIADHALETLLTDCLRPQREAASGFRERLESRLIAQLPTAPQPWRPIWLETFRYSTRRWQRGASTAVGAVLILSIAVGAFQWTSRPQPANAADIMRKAAATANDPAAAGIRSFHYVLGSGAAAPSGTTQRYAATDERWGALPNRWRIEHRSNLPLSSHGLSGDGGSTSDGTTEWSYDYYNRRLDVRIGALPVGSKTPLPIVFALTDGAVQPGMMPSYIPDCFHPKLVGEATVAGRPAYMLDLGPSFCPAGYTAYADGTVVTNPVLPPDQQGKSMMWIDTQTYFLLKQEFYKPDGTLQSSAEVTRIEYNIAIPDSVFTYAPPTDANVTDLRPGPYTLPSYPEIVLPGEAPDGLVPPPGTPPLHYPGSPTRATHP